jgi:hypothetical protein
MGRSVPLAVVPGGDYAFVPPAARPAAPTAFACRLGLILDPIGLDIPLA